jgi:hypothetical protein
MVLCCAEVIGNTVLPGRGDGKKEAGRPARRGQRWGHVRSPPHRHPARGLPPQPQSQSQAPRQAPAPSHSLTRGVSHRRPASSFSLLLPVCVYTGCPSFSVTKQGVERIWARGAVSAGGRRAGWLVRRHGIAGTVHMTRRAGQAPLHPQPTWKRSLNIFLVCLLALPNSLTKTM